MRCPHCSVEQRAKHKSDRCGSGKGRQKGKKAPNISKLGGADEALQPPLGTISHLDERGEALPPPRQRHMQHMQRAASDADDYTQKQRQSSTDSYNQAGTFTTQSGTWGISQTPDEALCSTQHEEHVSGPNYGLPNTTISTPPDLSASHAGSPPLHGMVHEALPYPWNPQQTSDHDIPLQPVFNGDGPSSLGDAGLWSLADAGYANDLSKFPGLDSQLSCLLDITDNPIEVGRYPCFEPQANAAPNHAIQVTQCSPSSSVSSSLGDQDSPNSTVFSHESFGTGGFPCSPSQLIAAAGLGATSNRLAPDFSLLHGPESKYAGSEHRISTACSREQPSANHPHSQGNSYAVHIYPRIASMASKPTPSHLNNPRNLSDNRATWGAENSQSYLQSMRVDQGQSEDSPNRKRKRSSNPPNAIMSGNSSSTQGNAPMPEMSAQVADPISDTIPATETLLACHFYKMNPKQHSSCRTKTFQSISSLGQHLRSAHSPKSRYSCESGFLSFRSEAALHAHAESGVCRLTGCAKLPIVSRKRGSQWSKWFTVWSQLFPNLPPPCSPYRDENLEVDQFVQHCDRNPPTSMPELKPEERQKFISWLRGEALRWRSAPGEPLNHNDILASPIVA